MVHHTTGGLIYSNCFLFAKILCMLRLLDCYREQAKKAERPEPVMGDARAGVLALFRQRPHAYNLPIGSAINDLKVDDLHPISKKSFGFFLAHKTLPAMSRVVFCKVGEILFLNRILKIEKLLEY
jgi:hypothetical protein